MNIIEVPNWENKKSFMVFDGTPSSESFLFDGDFDNFADCFFANPEWEAVEAWAEEQEYILVIEGTPIYQQMNRIFETEDLREVEDEFYNADGALNPGGVFDAGGHVIGERYLDRADYIRDILKDR